MESERSRGEGKEWLKPFMPTRTERNETQDTEEGIGSSCLKEGGERGTGEARDNRNGQTEA